VAAVTRWLDGLSEDMDKLRTALQQLGTEVAKAPHLEQIASWINARLTK
jgi:hypothetical protein